MSYTESHVKQLHRFSIYTVGRHYINNLIENCEFDQAGALLSRIFRGEKRLWEEEILRFIRLNQVASIGNSLIFKHQDKLNLTKIMASRRVVTNRSHI